MPDAQVLVVEDENIVAMDIQNTLRNFGYYVPSIASSGEDAVRKAEELQPDLVLMDIVLKGDIDGIDAAQQIRTRFDIPVVYLTAYSDEDTLQRAKISEPFGYILKPFKNRELHTAIELARYKHSAEKKMRESCTIVETAPDIIYSLSADGTITSLNPAFEKITGWPCTEWVGKPFLLILHPYDMHLAIEALKQSLSGETTQEDELCFLTKSGEYIAGCVKTIPQYEKEKVIGQVGFIRNISGCRKNAYEQKKLIAELRETLAKNRTLSGFITMCSSCRRIRDEKGQWNEIENYIKEHTDVLFTHSLCHECLKRLYPEQYKKMKERDKKDSDQDKDKPQ